MNAILRKEVLENKRFLEIIKIVRKVHGASHREFYEVYDQYLKLYEGFINNDDLLIKETLHRLRVLTHDYLVPNDVCETYQMVYDYIKSIDQGYQQI